METVPMKIIARIHNDFPSKFGIPRQSGLVEALKARVVFEPDFRSPEAVRGLEGFSHIWLIWQFSQAVREDWSPTVRPPRLGGNTRMGVFATRSPFRPNPLWGLPAGGHRGLCTRGGPAAGSGVPGAVAVPAAGGPAAGGRGRAGPGPPALLSEGPGADLRHGVRRLGDPFPGAGRAADGGGSKREGLTENRKDRGAYRAEVPDRERRAHGRRPLFSSPGPHLNAERAGAPVFGKNRGKTGRNTSFHQGEGNFFCRNP